MRTPLFLALCTFVFVSPVAASAATPPAPPAPAKSSEAATTEAKPSVEQLRRGIVSIERGGRVVALGSVLDGDGRILTALAPLGRDAQVDVRYADGTTVRARLGHQAKNWDLALLVPLSGRWTDGLRAGKPPPEATMLGTFQARGKAVAPLPLRVRGRIDARTDEGTVLPEALDLELRGAGVALGAPLIDDAGAVAGVLVRACRADEASVCVMTFIGAPVSAIRGFLAQTPKDAVRPAPFLGIAGAADGGGFSKGVRVLALAPGSPAAKAGLRASPERGKADLIVAVDGVPVDTPDNLAAAVGKYGVSAQVRLLLLRNDRFVEVPVVLEAAPPPP